MFHIYFNAPDKPENMGISQLTNDVKAFCEERASYLLNYEIQPTRIQFTRPDGNTGFATVTEVGDDFQN